MVHIDIQAGRESKGRNATEMLLSASPSDTDFGEFGGRELLSYVGMSLQGCLEVRPSGHSG